MIPLVYISESSRFYLVSVAKQISLCLAWSETPEDTFFHGVAQIYLVLVAVYIDIGTYWMFSLVQGSL